MKLNVPGECRSRNYTRCMCLGGEVRCSIYSVCVESWTQPPLRGFTSVTDYYYWSRVSPHVRNMWNNEIILYFYSVLILDSVLWGDTYLGGKFDAVFNVFFVFWVFFWEGKFGILGENSPQEIAENNTDFYCPHGVFMWSHSQGRRRG